VFVTPTVTVFVTPFVNQFKNSFQQIPSFESSDEAGAVTAKMGRIFALSEPTQLIENLATVLVVQFVTAKAGFNKNVAPAISAVNGSHRVTTVNSETIDRKTTRTDGNG
jgi:hypothetical protein